MEFDSDKWGEHVSIVKFFNEHYVYLVVDKIVIFIAIFVSCWHISGSVKSYFLFLSFIWIS